jgi:cation transport ATPase
VQVADAVIIIDDRIDRLADAVDVARRARRVALQSAVAGMGLPLLATAFAATGWLVPVIGALVQEIIDLAVILHARGGATADATRSPRTTHGEPAPAILG